MSDIDMVLVGTGAPADVAALTVAGVKCIAVADNFRQSPAAVSTMLSTWRGRAQLVIVDQNHATPPILAMINWPAVVVLDSPSAPSVYAARRLRLNFVVSNPVLHSMPAAGWRRIADLVGGPRTAKIEYYSLDAGEELALSRGLLGQLVGVACELLGVPSVDGALSLPTAAHSVGAAVLFRSRKMLHIVVQRIHGPRIVITVDGPEGHVEVRFPADEIAAPTPPAFWGVSGGQMWSGEHVVVPRSSYAVARVAQARYIVEVARRRQAPLHEPVALVSAQVFDVVKAAGTSPNGYACIGRRS